MNNWKKSKIGSFMRERSGRYDPSDKEVTGLKRLKKIDFSGEIHLSDKDSKTDMIIAHPGDLVISGINVAKGAIAVYSGEAPVAATIHYSSYSFDEKQINIEFFKRFIKSPLFEQTLKEQVRGGIKTEIKPKNFLPLEISLPDVKEQSKIVSFFKRIETEMSDLQKEIDSQESLIKQLRQQILQDAIEGRLTTDWRRNNHPLISGENHASELIKKIQIEKSQLVEKGKLRKGKPLTPITETFPLPKGWVWCQLGDLIISATDGPHFSPKYVESGVPFISGRNISPDGVDFSTAKHITPAYHQEISKKCKPEKGDILYTKGGTTGVACVNTSDMDFNVWVHVAVLKKSSQIEPFYIQHCLNSPHCYRQAQELTHGIGNQDLGLTRMINISTPLPPRPEQRVIVNKVHCLFEALNELEKQIINRKALSENLMHSVLREAFGR